VSVDHLVGLRTGEPRPAIHFQRCRTCGQGLWTIPVYIPRGANEPPQWSPRYRPGSRWIDGKLYCPNEANHPKRRETGGDMRGVGHP
jgi:hypothetical protein